MQTLVQTEGINNVQREYHKWHSPALNREMELLSYWHAGARVLVFPTSCGRFFDWENRSMIETLRHQIEQGWIQVFCLDSVDTESWFNTSIDNHAKTARHLQYHDYVINEVLPFTKQKNSNDFVIAAGASFGAYHSVSIALHYPQHFNRVLGMSGVYDVRDWTNNYMDDYVAQGSPCEYLARQHDPAHLDAIRKLEFVLPIGKLDPLFENNLWLSQLMWEKGIWHALRIWNEDAHDWPYWHQMIQMYLSGAD